MKKLAFAALVAAFALAACDSSPNDDAATDAAATTAGDTTIISPAPTATETTVVTTPGATTTTTTTADGDKVSVGPNGVSADVGDGDTRVRVDTDNPSMTVEKK